MVCKTLKELEDRWKSMGDKIEKSKFTREQARNIAKNCLDEIMDFSIYYEEKSNGGYDLLQAMSEIIHGLNISLDIAVSNYEEKHGINIWAKIFGNKDFKADFNLVKNELNNKLL